MRDTIKDIDRLSRSLKALNKMRDGKIADRVKALDGALKALRTVCLEDLNELLKKEHAALSNQESLALERRREDLLHAAKTAGLDHKRFSDYDRVGVFKVTYKGKRVYLELGSERFRELEESDGAKIFQAIEQATSDLEREEFSREVFFQTLKAAFMLARVQGKAQNSKVAVRVLFPYVVAAKQIQNENFLKRPESARFCNYSMPQFLYDLARFGRDGWSIGRERLRTQTPNMATIQAGKSVLLPSLKSAEGPGSPLAVLWLERKED